MKHANNPLHNVKIVTISMLFMALLSACSSFKQGFKEGWNSKNEVKK
jgi:hypothetical protein